MAAGATAQLLCRAHHLGCEHTQRDDQPRGHRACCQPIPPGMKKGLPGRWSAHVGSHPILPFKHPEPVFDPPPSCPTTPNSSLTHLCSSILGQIWLGQLCPFLNHVLRDERCQEGLCSTSGSEPAYLVDPLRPTGSLVGPTISKLLSLTLLRPHRDQLLL